MIFDVGTGLFFLSVLLLAAGCGGRRLYLLTLPAIVLLAIVQRDGCLPDEKNLQTETPPPSPAAETADAGESKNKS
jgi:hypothetical protein